MTTIKPKHLAGNLWGDIDQLWEDNGQIYRITDDVTKLRQYSILPNPDIIIGYTAAFGRSDDGQELHQALGAHMQIGINRLPAKQPGESRTVKSTLETQDQQDDYCDVPQAKLPKGQKNIWQRGHLLARELANINHEPLNFMTLTPYANSGSTEIHQVNGNNPEGMLYYENRLHDWLTDHQDCLLDYAVFPIYDAPSITKSLAPRRIQLQYCGISKNGNLIPIPIKVPDSVRSHVYKGAIMSVTLNNIQPGVPIDYYHGIAISPKRRKRA